MYSAVIISDIQWHAAAAFAKLRAQQNKYESILALISMLLTVCFVELLCCQYAKEKRAEVNLTHSLHISHA